MSTQRLQHALSQVLTRLRLEHEQLDATIATLEGSLLRPKRSASESRASQSLGGGRRSDGWTADARAAVAARMRAYWQARRAQKAIAEATQADSGDAGAAQAKRCSSRARAPANRSTAGWTDEARAEAAARMRARWHDRRSAAQGRA